MSTLSIVVSYNQAQHTIRCAQSLKDQARVVVWDNASTDDTTDRLKAIHPDVELHVNDENILWSPALNAAMDKWYDGEDHILFSNNDINYGPHVVDRLVATFEKPNAGIVAPAGSGLGGLQDFAVHHPTPQGISFGNWVAQQKPVRANYVVGAAMMVSKECWEDVGRFDEEMPLGADDHDYCIRAKAQGWTVWVASNAYVGHVSHATRNVAKAEWERYGKESWAHFNIKWSGYFHNEEEAKKAHWEAAYTPGWDYGTGWMSEADRLREWAKR